ncbi:MAG: virulence RhuM family protein [Sutterellaceae bacterium]|nr:virulence RhuM family protein [Sutterellaceae bacterium]
MDTTTVRNSSTDFLIFSQENGGDGIEVRVEDETIWLTQKLMATLFDTSIQNIQQHLDTIYQEHELDEASTIKNFLIVRQERSRSVNRNVKHYNLDAIIAVGYRVNSKRATLFRQWATKVLRDFVIRGYVLDRERLKNGKIFNQSYFDQLLEEIREIRASERLFYQKVTDIFATASDYDPHSLVARRFFACVQNKLHYAVHRHTAAEIIVDRANAEKPHMGLTTWKNVKTGGKILRTDVVVAKNYLTKDELDTLNRLVSMYLDMAELRAKNRIPTSMENWEKRLENFLVFNDLGLLTGSGTVSADQARAHALNEYEKFRVKQDRQYENAFDDLTASDDLVKEIKKSTESFK